MLSEARFERLQRNYWDAFIAWDKAKDIARFLTNTGLGVSFSQRSMLLKQYYNISSNVDCPHVPEEIFAFEENILTLPNTVQGCVVEAGCFKGGSTAKFNRATKLAKRELVVFDSFEGIPENCEPHAAPGQENFSRGSHRGSLEEVKRNVERYGDIEVCRFIKGWFDDTMPTFSEPVAAAYLDVDLVSSTRTCLKYLYPLLQPGGTLFSQDGHLPLIVELFEDPRFWEEEVGSEKPEIMRSRSQKLLRMVKKD